MTIFKDDYATPLGIIRCEIESDSTIRTAGNSNRHFTSKGHAVRFQIIEIPKEIVGDLIIESSRCWRYFIEKINDENEQLTLFCKLMESSGVTCGGATGEFLDAIEIEGNGHIIHIGTEDREIMQQRALSSNDMPNRFHKLLMDFNSFTEPIECGFRTKVPTLNKGEVIYFHFLAATNSRKQSKEYPDEEDISTWFAVDIHKCLLDKFLGIGYGG
jgi:hypothetical protein